MMDRHFNITTREYGDTFRPAFEISCGECGQTDQVWNSDSSVNSAKARKKWEERGWIVGAGPKADRCPVCADRIRNPRKKPVLKVVKPGGNAEEGSMAATIDARNGAPFPEISPAVRAKIPEMYMILGDYFDAAKGRYRDGWSDARVARETGLSEAMVKSRRESDFGKLKDRRGETAVADALKAFDIAINMADAAGGKVSAALAEMSKAMIDLRKAHDLLKAAKVVVDEEAETA